MSQSSILQKRARGRPPGTGLDDTSQLVVVADMMLADPSLKATTAMRRAFTGIGPSHLRRLQAKWRKGSSRFVMAAREKVRPRVETANDVRGMSATPSLAALEALLPSRESLLAMERLLEPIRRMQEAVRPFVLAEETMRPFRELFEQTRQIQQVFESARVPRFTIPLPKVGAFVDLPGLRGLSRW